MSHPTPLELSFAVDYVQLGRYTYVPDPVRLHVLDPDHEVFVGLLGESGKRMARAGFAFAFSRKLADQLLNLGVATLAPEEEPTNEADEN